jgi:hypothetical protein
LTFGLDALGFAAGLRLLGAVVGFVLGAGVVVVPGGVVEVDVEIVAPVEVDGWQLSLTFLTGPVTGSWIWESGVFAGTSTLKLSVCPLSSVTWIVQESAEAAGSMATPDSASTAPLATIPYRSFRPLNKVLISSRRCCRGTRVAAAALRRLPSASY